SAKPGSWRGIMRLAGLVGAREWGGPATLLGRMLEASRSTPTWGTRAEKTDEATAGLCGRQAHNITPADGGLAVVEGSSYNPDEPDPSETDAQLVAALYRRHGFVDALRRLNGDFAVALYDSRQGTLWLGRDRFGVRPLYYAGRGEGLAFASRPRALLA